MATFFGEVILPSSRAFFEDFDDDETESSDSFKPKLTLKKYFDPYPKGYDALIIADGVVAKGFTQMFMQQDSDKLMAEIEVSQNEEKDSYDIMVLNPRKVEPTKLFLLSNNCLLLLISKSIDLRLSNQLTILIRPWLSVCKRLISLVSQHSSNYRCDTLSGLPVAFVRALTTSHLPFPSHLKYLEQPNFISNVPASVLSWCEGSGGPGLLLALYTDQEITEELTVTPLLQAFKDPALVGLLLKQPASLSLNSSLKNMDKSFMYM